MISSAIMVVVAVAASATIGGLGVMLLVDCVVEWRFDRTASLISGGLGMLMALLPLAYVFKVFGL